MEVVFLNFLNGISYGMILFLLAAGFSLIFGTMGIMNLAHGSLYLVGAFLGLTIVGLWGNFWLALLGGAVGAAIVGLLLERVLLARLYKQLNEQVLLTLGLVYVFGNLILWVYGPASRMGTAPPIVSGAVTIAGLAFPVYRFLLIGVGVVVVIGLWWLLERTRVGAVVRAGMDDKQMTEGLGINYRVICSGVFALGALLGGFAGFIGIPIVGAHYDAGFDILLLAAIVVIVGGVGSVPGALVGAMVIGLIDTFGRAYFPDFALFTIYLAMIVILLVRPVGLLPRRL